MDLKEARKVIDEIDEKTAALFCERMETVRSVVAYKMKNSLPVFDPSREIQVLEKNVKMVKDTQLQPYFETFLKYQMEISKSFQRQIMKENTVAYQGAAGAFGHMAAVKQFPNDMMMQCETFYEVVDAVEKGKASFGVLPFENSFTGEVGEVLDLLYKGNVFICAMFDLPVEHHLMTVKGGTIRGVEAVYSHPQALDQCGEYLRKTVKDARLIPYGNTALAAAYVAEQGNPAIAAVASEEAAKIYGLEILARGINTSRENTTRFIVITRENTMGGNRFNLMFTVNHAAGSLAKVTSCIGSHGFNMECIRSRSLRNEPWKYVFYTELVGIPDDAQGKALLAEMNSLCANVKILGTYTREENESERDYN